MDFSQVDIVKILKKSIDKRFQDFTPQDFEDFIAQLYKDRGYKVEQTSYSGDYGADILIEKDEIICTGLFSILQKYYKDQYKRPWRWGVKSGYDFCVPFFKIFSIQTVAGLIIFCLQPGTGCGIVGL